MKDHPQPIDIRRESSHEIEIEFDDGKVVRWTSRQLREVCPCATCREKKRGDQATTQNPEKDAPASYSLPVISASEARPLTILGMRPVGQYGYCIDFSDGHSSGIFLFDSLYDAPSKDRPSAR